MQIEAKHFEWKNRRVVVTVNLPKPNAEGLTAIEIDGTLTGVHERGIMIKPRGRTTPEMIAPEQLESFELYDEIPQPIEQKVMAEVPFGKIRQHLADRHAFSLLELNASNYTETPAYDDHLRDHDENGETLSHRHED